jgi:solute:Na+ symporter, SSS family
MSVVDFVVVGVYLVASLVLGLYLARRGSGSLVDFFLGGRAIPWWLAGTSMAATTFSVDTPLYIAGVVGTRGIAGNWEWWSFAVAHVLLVCVFARLWRRAAIVTDAELTELRYGGRPAAVLRGAKSFLFAVVINSVGIGYAMLAMVKVIDALEILPGLGLAPGEGAKLWSVVAVSVLVLLYCGVAGLWGVVATDFFQFVLGLAGAIVVAVVAVAHVGGLGALVSEAQRLTAFDVLSVVPIGIEGGRPAWSALAGISGTTFLAYVFVQWWAFRRSDGGGEFIQRLAASRDEREAERAAWLFVILHYIVRTWPWVLVGLVALVIYPDLEDRELGYPRLMLDLLPAGVLGLVVASLVAAFMSTVSTLINWGASYLTNDLYARFLRPQAGSGELVLAGRVASVVVTALGAVGAFLAEDIATVFRLIIAIGTGPGLVLILRWFWWRINAWTELAAMLAGFLVGLATSVVPALVIADFGARLIVTSLVTAAIWVPVMLLSPPERDETLDGFYRRVRPGGPGWQRQRRRAGLEPAQDLGHDLLRACAALVVLLAFMLAVGFAVLVDWSGLAVSGIVTAGGVVWLWRLGAARTVTPPGVTVSGPVARG